ncbi:hypothetical protein FM037_16620 [Shewanella psychropiezotolerans]|uniref:Uncharacterized protein n=1 Tax=Shewanella psychropiezotolerans TaxID=2593655 RepID=A0ABX5WZL1_9GAMM|nr:hypothetical protein [Shewanella psychropiezotolerans]QDO84533.1 hypothetical protein FM037_16620 [Shewanella psychropiezotolerans]
MKHELWIENEDEQTFCLSGPHGDDARRLLEPEAKLTWTCEASSNFEAMTKYYEHMSWGEYKSDYPEENKKTYSELGWE